MEHLQRPEVRDPNASRSPKAGDFAVRTGARAGSCANRSAHEKEEPWHKCVDIPNLNAATRKSVAPTFTQGVLQTQLERGRGQGRLHLRRAQSPTFFCWAPISAGHPVTSRRASHRSRRGTV